MATVSLKPSLVHLKGVRAGDENKFQVNVTQDGQPYDITGKSFTASARTDPMAQSFLDAIIDVIDSEGGVLMVSWPGDEVRDWLDLVLTEPESSATGVWDLQMTDDAQKVTTIAAGNFAADYDVTR